MSVSIGIDQGTTGTRVVAFDDALNAVTDAYRPVPSHHPRPGWVEKDAEAVVTSVHDAVAEVVATVGVAAVSATGLDNEGETVVAWDALTLRPLAPAIVWSCRRSEQIVERLRADGVEERVRALAGTPLEPYFSSTKITWLLENDPAVQAAARAGRARFGTLDAYLLARLGDGAHTEPSTAARTQLQAVAAPGRWDPELCRIFGVDIETLPPIGPSIGELGSIAGLQLRAMLVDQTAALAGHGCVSAGDTKATYGTGVFLLAHAGADVPTHPSGLLPTVAWTTPEATAYALDGGVFSAGAAVNWLRDSLGLIASADETEALARSVPDTSGVRFLPALTGLAAPWWRSDARASWHGMTAHTSRAHLVRAVLESLTLRVRDIVEALAAAGTHPQLIRVDGGMTRNRWLMQRQADVLGIPIRISPTAEATALGVAAFAGIAHGSIELADLAALAAEGTTLEPTPASALWREPEYAAWLEFVHSRP
jgi:glycerol kinase